jgi:peptidoglycan/xylan/chitin deacetylase (PgdA/CDA1 family)
MGTRAVLTYHSIDRSGSPISVTPESFRAHVEWMAGSGIAVVPLADLLSGSDDRDAIALTFDDGLATVATEAAPLLRSHGFPATIFVVSGRVGRDNRWRDIGDSGIPRLSTLDWQSLERLQAQGIEVGAHSQRHAHLRACGPAELEDEIAGCADQLTARLGERPRSFAYPYGETPPAAVALVRRTYEIGCTTEFRLASARTAPELVPRLDAWYFRDGKSLRRWGSPGFARSVAIRHLLRRVRRLAAGGPAGPPRTGGAGS